jgi:hypothetical protein
MNSSTQRAILSIINILTVLLAVLLTIISICGAYVADTYQRDHPSMAAQGIGQDLVDLFFVVPLLVTTLILMNKKYKSAMLIFGGIVFYILYSFVIYCFGVHFNQLFLLYCLTLGISFYLFIIYVSYLKGLNVQNWFKDDIPTRSISLYFVVIALFFYFVWLNDIMPAIIENTIPHSVKNYDLLVNPIHVIDLSIALPGLIISAYLLMKRNFWGYILTPFLLVFTIILAVALAGMVVMLKVKNISDDLTVAGILVVLVLMSTIFLLIFLKRMNNTKIIEKSKADEWE